MALVESIHSTRSRMKLCKGHDYELNPVHKSKIVPFITDVLGSVLPWHWFLK